MTEWGVPSPPRRVRRRAWLAHRWGLGVAGGLLLGNAVVLEVAFCALAGTWLPFADLQLDRGAVRSAARLTDGERHSPWPWAPIVVRYEFDADGRTWSGASHMPGDGQSYVGGEWLREHAPREPVVEYLAGDPAVNRLAGTRRAAVSWWGHAPSLALTSLGLWAVVLWLRDVARVRRLLVRGLVTEASIVRAEALPADAPTHLRVQYELRDTAGEVCAGVQWTRVGQALAEALAKGSSTWPALVVRGRSRRHRLVAPEDFSP